MQEAEQHHNTMQATSFEQLPAPALVSVLRGVPQGVRLQQLARVCRAWAAASTDATTDVCFLKRRHLTQAVSKQLEALHAWLDKHSRQVVSLTADLRDGLGTSSGPTLRLACGQLQQLQRLEVRGVTLSLQPASSSSSSQSRPAALPALRSVSLKACSLTPNSLALLHPAHLTALVLQRANLQKQRRWAAPNPPRCPAVAGPPLPRLPMSQRW